MRRHRSVIDPPTEICPECGALVRLIGVRWLAAHPEGGINTVHPQAVARRCPGSFLAVTPPTPRGA